MLFNKFMKFGIAEDLYLELVHFGSINLNVDLVDRHFFLGKRYSNLGF